MLDMVLATRNIALLIHIVSKNNTTISPVPLNPSSFDKNVGILVVEINLGYLYETGFGDLEFGFKMEYSQSQKTSQDIISKIASRNTTSTQN